MGTELDMDRVRAPPSLTSFLTANFKWKQRDKIPSGVNFLSKEAAVHSQ